MPVRLTAPASSPPREIESPQGAPQQLVGARNFVLDYDLEDVGPWGVSKVELWGTRDGGKSWQSYGVDPDNVSPFEVLVDRDGVYGFVIQVDGAGGPSLPPPGPDARPEVLVEVDITPPAAEIVETRQPDDRLPHQLVIRWDAADDNLSMRPIGLYYSSSPNGPWTTIAASLQNRGEFAWRLPRHVPADFYLRLEVRDTAGNVTNVQTPEPIRLRNQRPTVRIRAIRAPQDTRSQ